MDVRHSPSTTTTTTTTIPPQQPTAIPPPEFSVSIFSDPESITPLLKSVLHTIFFHRYFPNVRPTTHQVLHLTLPYVDAPELTQVIDNKVHLLTRQLVSGQGPHTSVRGGIGVQFFEKRRRVRAASTGGAGQGVLGLFGVGRDRAEEEICWEIWRVEVTLAMPRTAEEQKKVTRAMETSLQKTIMKIITVANRYTDHIPAITTNEGNPFPYQIIINPKNGNGG